MNNFARAIISARKYFVFIFSTFFFASFLFFFLILVQNTESQEICSESRVTATTGVYPSEIASDEWAEVRIAVKGYSGRSAEIIPFEVMLVVDRSTSMLYSDPHNKRLEAALNFIRSAPAGSGIKIGLAFFGYDGVLVSPLTEDYTSLATTLLTWFISSGLDDNTNLMDGMQVAQSELLSSGVAATRTIILLTDGFPGPEPSYDDQVRVIYDSILPKAVDERIRYYTVGLHPPDSYVDIALLRSIAEITNGEYYDITDSDALPTLYGELFATIAHRFIAGNVVLHEIVSSSLRIKPGSLWISAGLSWPSDDELTTFYDSGNLSIKLGDIACSRERSISFQVQCGSLDPDSPADRTRVLINDDRAKVTYVVGAVRGEIPIENQELVCLRPGELHVEKGFTGDMELSIKLKNNYLLRDDYDNTIKNMRVIEMLTDLFQAERTSFRLSSPPSLSHYVKLFPSSPIDTILWYIKELAPQEEAQLTFNIVTRACDHDLNPLRVNKIGDNISYINPRGVTKLMDLPELSKDFAFLERCNERPDLHIDANETYKEYTTSLSVIKSFPTRRFPDAPYMVDRKFDSPSIWADSKANGIVEDWSNPDEVRTHIWAGELTPPLKILGQGDILGLDDICRIYASIKNVGENVALNGKVHLFIIGRRSVRRDIAFINIDPLPPGDVKYVFVELPRLRALVPSSYIYSEDICGALFADRRPPVCFDRKRIKYFKLGVEILPADGEKHTNDNYATEFIMIR